MIVGPLLGQIAGAGQVRAFSAATSSALQVSPLGLSASFFLGPLAGSAGGPTFLFRAENVWKGSIAYSVVNRVRGGNAGRRGLRNAKIALAMFAVHDDSLCLSTSLGWATLVAKDADPARSTRWPFREITILLFLFHLLFVLYHNLLAARVRRIACLAALAPMLLLLAKAPTLNPMELSRRLLISGTADEYWRALRPTLGNRPNLTCMDPQLMRETTDEVPFRAATQPKNLAALFGAISASGYSSSSAFLLDKSRPAPFTPSGMYSPENGRAYQTRFPNVRLTIVRQLNPPLWSILEDGRERWLTLDPDTLQIRELTSP